MDLDIKAENETSTVSGVGCGWYGWPLAECLKSSGWMVKGSKTTNAGVRALRASGIDGYLLHLVPRPGAYDDKALFDVDVLVVNIPPGRRPDVESHHMEQMHALGELFAGSPVTKVIFISSTSVYPESNRIVTERDDLPPDTPAGKALRGAEKF